MGSDIGQFLALFGVDESGGIFGGIVVVVVCVAVIFAN
jgi:ribonuclease HIII